MLKSARIPRSTAARSEDTVIGDGVKLDNQIMVAHNVRIGAHTAVAACVGIAGSTTIGERCTIGGASMLSGHLTLADGVRIFPAVPPLRRTFPNLGVTQGVSVCGARRLAAQCRCHPAAGTAAAPRAGTRTGIILRAWLARHAVKELQCRNILMELDIKGILDRLPHRYPMLLIDRVIDIQPGKSIVALKNVSINEPLLHRTFPSSSRHAWRPDPGTPWRRRRAVFVHGCLRAEERGCGGDVHGVLLRRHRRGALPPSVLPGDQLRIEVDAGASAAPSASTPDAPWWKGSWSPKPSLMCAIRSLEA